MRYFKRRWDEDRGDEHADWGASWWFFEIGPDGYPVRQVEEYDSGIRLRYGLDHSEDEFGGLGFSHVSSFDPSPSPDEALTAAEFEAVWTAGSWHNL